MVTIPFKLREKYGLNEGSEVFFIEEERTIILVPRINIKDFRHLLPSKDEMLKIIDENEELEMKLETES